MYFTVNNLQKMKLALIQFSPVWENKVESQNRVQSLTDKIVDVDLLIFPEMTLTGFSMNSKSFAEKIDGSSFQFFSSIAKEKNVNIIYGFIENLDNSIFNSSVHLNRRGEVCSVYHKIHPFSYSEENKHYTAGANSVVTNIDDAKTGLSICYDLRFPELFRLYGKEKVDLIINIANWPQARVHHWDALLRARAIENLCFIAAVNRVGTDPKLNYTGHSSIYTPLGDRILFSENDEDVLIAEINLDEVKRSRKNFPFLDDIKLI